MKRLTETERETLQRLADEFGLKAVGDHTGLSTRMLTKALDADHNLSDSQHRAVAEYLSVHV